MGTLFCGLLKSLDGCRLSIVAVADGGGGDDRVEGDSLSTQPPGQFQGEAGIRATGHTYIAGEGRTLSEHPWLLKGQVV